MLLAAWLSWGSLAAQDGGQVRFKEVTSESGLLYMHGFQMGPATDPLLISGGVAAGDFDRDGWTDLYLVRGDIGANLLFRNRGDGTFEEMGHQAGVSLSGTLSCGPAFADWDGDGWPDLIVGGVEGTAPRLFRNRGDGTFEESGWQAGLHHRNSMSAAFGDYDRDGDLDLFLSHWGRGRPVEGAHMWRNDGAAGFTPLPDPECGLNGYDESDYTFTPNFADINSDGWPDLLVTGDFNTSQIFLNRHDGTFENISTPVLTDENGMGAAVADYDNDGDLDWFVSSIWDPDGAGVWGVTGNRLYNNRGDGTFDDVTDSAGVRRGYWGWGSCFADFNNDGHLDLFHVNGYRLPDRPGEEPVGDDPTDIFVDDPSRLFISDGRGAFEERSAQAGLDDRGQGRGVVCFDYDRDGDVDIFVANNSGLPSLYQNDSQTGNRFLTVQLLSPWPGQTPVGSRVWVTAGGITQMRELQAGSNFVSQQPEEIHFGLGKAATIDELRVQWPDGRAEAFSDVLTDQLAVIGGSAAPQLLARREFVFPYVPVGRGAQVSLLLANRSLSAAGGTLAFFGSSGKPRRVTLEGLGTASSFSLGSSFLPSGESKSLAVRAEGREASLMAVFSTVFPVDVRFRMGNGCDLMPAAPSAEAQFEASAGPELELGLALANPGDAPLRIRLLLLDGKGTVRQTANPPLLNPLPAHGHVFGALSQLGLPIRQIPPRSGWKLKIVLTKGKRLSVLGLARFQGRSDWLPLTADN